MIVSQVCYLALGSSSRMEGGLEDPGPDQGGGGGGRDQRALGLRGLLPRPHWSPGRSSQYLHPARPVRRLVTRDVLCNSD